MELKNNIDPVEYALMPENVRRLCSALICDVVGRPAALKQLASTDPLFVVRSARPSLFKEFLDSLHEELPDQPLVILSHEKDRGLVQESTLNPYEFFAYPVGGPYSRDVFSDAFPALLGRRFGARILIDTTGVLAGLQDVVSMLKGLQGGKLFSWADSGLGLIELSSSKKSQLAQEALSAIARWNACRLDLDNAD